ncbi:MAG: MBL fold metallo-hydrolase [Acidobacteriota bacterium]
MQRLQTIGLAATALIATIAVCAQAPASLSDKGTPAKGKGKAATADSAAKGKGRGGAQQAEKAPTPPPVPQVLRRLRPGLYLVTGHGGNVLFHTTTAGVILVDTKLPGDGNFETLMDLIRGITDQPVKIVFNTHHHADHTGNNDKFLALGAQVIAPEQLKANLTTYSFTPKPAPPSVTYASTYTAKLGGVEARAYHFSPGHTSGDAVVLFPAQRVIAVSDLARPNRTPVIDYAGGGSILGWVKALDEILKLDWDTAVSGNGEPTDRAFVETYRKNLQTLIDRGRMAVAQGASKEQLMSRIKTDDLGWTFAFDADQLSHFYSEMGGK